MLRIPNAALSHVRRLDDSNLRKLNACWANFHTTSSLEGLARLFSPLRLLSLRIIIVCRRRQLRLQSNQTWDVALHPLIVCLRNQLKLTKFCRKCRSKRCKEEDHQKGGFIKQVQVTSTLFALDDHLEKAQNKGFSPHKTCKDSIICSETGCSLSTATSFIV